MHVAFTSFESVALGAVRWVARLTASFLLLLFTVFAMGEGVRVDRLTGLETLVVLSLTVALMGLLVAWRYEMLGGSLVLAGMAVFYLLELTVAGQSPGGWIFPLMPFAGALFVIDSQFRRYSGLD